MYHLVFEGVLNNFWPRDTFDLLIAVLGFHPCIAKGHSSFITVQWSRWRLNLSVLQIIRIFHVVLITAESFFFILLLSLIGPGQETDSHLRTRPLSRIG